MFLNLSEAANLALHAMAHMARDDAPTPLPAASIAKSLEVSAAHLVKVLQRLKKAGLVRSIRGPGGGYALARDASEIRLLDIYEAIDGRLEVGSCLLGHRVCDRENCIFGTLLHDIGSHVGDHFTKTTLATLSQSG